MTIPSINSLDNHPISRQIASFVGNPHTLSTISKGWRIIAHHPVTSLNILNALKQEIGPHQYQLLLIRISAIDKTPYQKVQAIYTNLLVRFDMRADKCSPQEMHHLDLEPGTGMIVTPSQYRRICNWMRDVDFLREFNFRMDSPQLSSEPDFSIQWVMEFDRVMGKINNYLQFTYQLLKHNPLKLPQVKKKFEKETDKMQEQLKGLSSFGADFQQLASNHLKDLRNIVTMEKLLPESLLVMESISLSPGADFPVEIQDATQLRQLNISGEDSADVLCLNEIPNWILRLQFLTELDISGNQLVEAPSSIGNLRCLTSLNLSENSIVKVGSKIGDLTQLTNLDLTDNYLNALPDECSKLLCLKVLNLGKNYFTQIPPALTELKLTFLNLACNQIMTITGLFRVQKLSIAHNPITSIDGINGALRSVQTLNMSGAFKNMSGALEKMEKAVFGFLGVPTIYVGSKKERPFERRKPDSQTCIAEIPLGIRYLTNLTELNMRGNKLKIITPGIDLLPQLRTLDLSHNELEDLPESFANLRLTVLDLHCNEFQRVPPALDKLVTLEALDFTNNPLSVLMWWKRPRNVPESLRLLAHGSDAADAYERDHT